jgi:hypothetical protein
MTLSSGPNLGLLENGALGEPHYAELVRLWRGIDGLMQPTVKSATAAAPPATPTNGDRYLIPTGATGAWAGHTGQLARWTDKLATPSWEFFTPKAGWDIRVTDQLDATGSPKLYTYSGTAWAQASSVSGTAGAMLNDFSNNPATTAALVYGYFGGMFKSDSTPTAVAGGTIALTASATNYVELAKTGAVNKNTTGFTPGAIPLAKVATGAGAITSITDQRCFLTAGTSKTSVYLNAAQSLPATTFVKVGLNTVEIDTDGIFAAANSRCTPKTPGWYQVEFAVTVNKDGAATTLVAFVYKNGTPTISGNRNDASVGSSGSNGAKLLYFNGSTDYCELFIYCGNASGTVVSDPVYTYLNVVGPM